jgi:hypothetical protein
MGVKEYFATGLCGLVLGVVGGVAISKHYTEPVAIYEKKVEGDSRNFLVLQRRGSDKIPFVKQADGSFKRLDDVQSDESEAKRAELEALTKKLKE